MFTASQRSKRTPGLLALGFVALSTALLWADHESLPTVMGLKRGLHWLASPLIVAAEVPSELGYFLTTWFRRQSDWVNAQSLWESERELLRHAQRQQAALLEENTHLRELLKLHTTYELPIRATAQVTPRSYARARVEVDMGEKEGVSVGLPALAGKGVFGTVVELRSHRADVLHITDRTHALPIKIARSGFRSIAQGNGQDMLRLQHVPETADVQVGDEVVTSGLGEKFQPNLPVGRVVRIDDDPKNPFHDVWVEPLTPKRHSDFLAILEAVAS